MQTVSVWDHRPTPDEVLHKRLEAGWEPIPSELQEGLVVQGYAACVFGGGGSGQKESLS